MASSILKIDLTVVLSEQIWQDVVKDINSSNRKNIFKSNDYLQDITLSYPSKGKILQIEYNVVIGWEYDGADIPFSSLSQITLDHFRNMFEEFINWSGQYYSSLVGRKYPSFQFYDIKFTPTGVIIFIKYDSEPDFKDIDYGVAYSKWISLTWNSEGKGYEADWFPEYQSRGKLKVGPEIMEHPEIFIDEDDWDETEHYKSIFLYVKE